MKIPNTIRIPLLVFMILLVLSGLTAFPIRTEVAWFYGMRSYFPSGVSAWIAQVYEAVKKTPQSVFYGTDWLAFAHIIIALFFIPLYRQPLQYQANIYAGMAACIAVFPLAFICGPIRGIPFFHQLIDCSFGAIGFSVLYYINHQINSFRYENKNT